MPMNPQLAALYGTASEETVDVEKLAAAKLAEGLAEEEQLEVADLTDEQVEELASQYLASEQEEEAAAVEEPAEKEASVEEPKEGEDEEEMTEAQQKLAEADFLGRAMAHAYVHELKEIEKQAGIGAAAKTGAGKVANFVKSHKKGLAIGAGAAAAAGAGALAAKKMKDNKEKKSAAEPSALDILAERRAIEILKENGIELEQPKAEEPEVVEQPEKTGASEAEMTALANAVEQRAFEMLKANGYVQEEEPAAEEKQGE